MQKEKNETKDKPKYSMAGNAIYMIKLAWREGYRSVPLLCLASVIFTTAANLINLYISPAILSAVERRVPLTELLLTIGAFTGGIMLTNAINAYIGANTLFGRIAVRLEIIRHLNRKVATTSYPNLDNDKFWSFMKKSQEATWGNNQATEAVWDTLTNLCVTAIGFIIYASLITSADPILIFTIILTSCANYFIGKYLRNYGYRHREEDARLEKQASYAVGRGSDVSFAKDIRIFWLSPWIKELSQKTMDAYTAYHKRAESVYFWAGITDIIMTFLRNGIAYAYLIGLVVSGGLSVPEFLLIFGATNAFTSAIGGLLGNLSTLHSQSIHISIVREGIEFEEPFKFDEGESLSAIPDKMYEIKLENVTFRYPGADRDVLKNLSLTLHPGEKLAVVGLNGAGKTTLVKLICGFLDPTEGRITLDGRDIREYNRRDYYTMFTAVFQSFSLLASSIAANIAQDEDNIDMARVRDCADKAGLTKKIESLSEGFETRLYRQVYDDAVMLSGGETQRLMLARALYKDAPIIILDEPTAALDPIAESDMYMKYNDMTKGRSSVYISHRLASTRFCDRIIMLANAGITEEGTHDELIAKGGEYARLFAVQSKYYKEGAHENEGYEG